MLLSFCNAGKSCASSKGRVPKYMQALLSCSFFSVSMEKSPLSGLIPLGIRVLTLIDESVKLFTMYCSGAMVTLIYSSEFCRGVQLNRVLITTIIKSIVLFIKLIFCVLRVM